MLTRPPVPGTPDDPAARIRLGRIAVTPAEMKQIFDVVIDPVITLVRGQISGITGQSWERNVSAIVLVGGFSECNYLVKRLRAEVQTDTMPILRSPNACVIILSASLCTWSFALNCWFRWTAVARGAVMKGLKTVVMSRQAPCAFGTSHSSVFREGQHKDMYKYV
jgi:hypothetical protein